MGAYDLLRRARPGRLYLVTAPTYPMLTDASWRALTWLARDLCFARQINRGDLRLVLGNGAEVLGRSTLEPDRLRGPNLSGVWMDEASQSEKEAFDIAIACLREGGEQGFLTATFTPRGKQHWTYDVFAGDRPDAAIFKARTRDNPFLPGNFHDTIARQYTSALAAQELEGEFTDLEGALFRRHWFKVVEQPPPAAARIRAWDLAATAAKEGEDPDWTAGVLLQRGNDYSYTILDVRRLRGTPAQVERLIRATAEEDGVGTHIWMEQEPGASGVALIDHYARRVLQGFVFRGERSTGDKATRAQPLASMAEHGNVHLVRGRYVKDFLDECALEGTNILTSCGAVPIEAVVAGDRVMTREGWNKVLFAELTGRPCRVIRISLENNAHLNVTGNHPVYVVGRGFVPASFLRQGDRLLWLPSATPSFTRAVPFTGIPPALARPEGPTIQAAGTGRRRTSTACSTGSTLAQSLTGAMSIMWTATRSTTTRPTLPVCPPASTSPVTGLMCRPALTPAVTAERPFDPERLRTSCTALGCAPTPPALPMASCRPVVAPGAERRSRRSSLASCAARSPAASATGAQSAKRSTARASSAVGSFTLTTPAKLPVLEVAVSRLDTVTGGKVYNLKVERCPEYFANGVLVHNCEVFPLGTHDDQVDAASLAYSKLAVTLSRGEWRMQSF